MISRGRERVHWKQTLILILIFSGLEIVKRIFSLRKHTLDLSFWDNFDTHSKLTTCKNDLLQPVVVETQSRFLKK